MEWVSLPRNDYEKRATPLRRLPATTFAFPKCSAPPKVPRYRFSFALIRARGPSDHLRWRWHFGGRDGPGKGLLQRKLTGDGKLVLVADSFLSFGYRPDASDPGGHRAWRTDVVR